MLSASLPSLRSHAAPACCEILPREGEGPGAAGDLFMAGNAGLSGSSRVFLGGFWLQKGDGWG